MPRAGRQGLKLRGWRPETKIRRQGNTWTELPASNTRKGASLLKMLWAHCGNSSTNPGDMPGQRAWPPSASGDTQGEPRQHVCQHLSEELNQLHLAAQPRATWPCSQPDAERASAFCLTNVYKTL